MSGYSQGSVAGLLVEYREREERLTDHPGRNGLAGCAVLLDVDFGLERVPGWVQTRASEWIDGVDFDRYADPRKMPDTLFEPQLVENIPDLQEAIREAHDAESHLVRFQGRWTSIEGLLRMLDDTRAIRRLAGAMSRKANVYMVHAGPAHRGVCHVCSAWLSDVTVWRSRRPDKRWCLAHGANALDMAQGSA